jgi:hypothetical protein
MTEKGAPVILNLVQHSTTLAASPASAGDAVERAFSVVQALPLEAHAAMGLVLLGGIALWLFGGRLLKPLFGLLGLALGGLIGMVALPAFGLREIGGVSGALIGLGVGAVVGLTLAMVLLKAAIVFAAGAGFAVLGFLGGTIYTEHNPMSDDQPPAFVVDDADRAPGGRLLFTNPVTGERMTIDRLTESLREAQRVLGGVPKDEAGQVDRDAASKRFESIAVLCQAVVAEAREAVTTHWNGLSVRERLVVVGSSLGSLVVGLLVGLLMPKRATAGVTALAGSAITLAAGVWLIDALAPGMARLTTQPPEAWAVVWGVMFLAGMVAQLAGLGRAVEPAKPSKKKADDDEGDEEE